MIDKKKIKEAADEYCAPLFSETTPRPHRQSWSGDTIIFKAGINWFKENLWHDASEEPKEAGKYLLCKCSNGEYLIHIMEPTPDEWQERCEFIGITRWLYIEDLMKGGM